MHTFFNPVKEGWLCKQGITLSHLVNVSLCRNSVNVLTYSSMECY